MATYVHTSRLSNYCEDRGILPEEQQCGFRPGRSTVDKLFVVRRLQELGREREKSPYICASLTCRKRTYDFFDRELLLWQVLTRFGVLYQPRCLQLHDGMRACVRTADGGHSESFDVTQALRQGCVLSPLLFNVFFAAVIHVAVGFKRG